MMTLWERFREWVGHWFIHDSAAKSGVSISMPALPPQQPAAPAPAPAPAAPAAPAVPAPAAPAPVLLPANPVQATLSTAENVVKLLGTAVTALKNSGLISGGNSRPRLPDLNKDSDAGDSDAGDSDSSSSDGDTASDPDFVNDSSDVVN